MQKPIVIPTSPEDMARIRYSNETLQEASNIAAQYEESAARIRATLIRAAKRAADGGDDPLDQQVAAEYVAEVVTGEVGCAAGYVAQRAAAMVRVANNYSKYERAARHAATSAAT